MSLPNLSQGLPRGLSDQEAAARRASGQGNNTVVKTGRTYGQILRENVFTFFNIVLFSIGLLLLLLGDVNDAILTAFTGLLNASIASFQEARAKKKLDHIALLTRPQARVIRDGQEKSIDPAEIVVGDLLVIGPGDQVLVDGALAGEGRLEMDESLLTGESDLIPKRAGDTLLSGSFVVSGKAIYEAQKVGEHSFINQLSQNARSFVPQITPLQRQVNQVVRLLLLLVLFFGVVILLANIRFEQLTLAQSLKAASVTFGLAPASLFLMIVLAYALGAVRIADQGALVQVSNAIESLCHVSVLCLDKTGTLTANQIRLEQIEALNTPGGPAFSQADLQRILGCYARSASASNATNEAVLNGTPGEKHLFQQEVPFSSKLKWSAMSFNEPALRGTYVLGANEMMRPSLVENPRLAELQAAWSGRGWRVLTFACLPEAVPLQDAHGEPILPPGLFPIALLAFSDVLRPEARETLAGFKQAGIQIKIISGDNPETVAALAQQAGLGANGEPVRLASGVDLAEMDSTQLSAAAREATIFGRITPEQKEKLVRTLKDQGHYVAMTGDGVNDVMALKQAQVGIAMQSGSQATRSVADIVLLNDSFSALPKAFLDGQRILNGLLDVLRLYLSNIVALAIEITFIAMLQLGFPFLPGQNSAIAMLAMSIPSFFLTTWARPGPAERSSLLKQIGHFVIPAGVFMSVANLIVYLYFIFSSKSLPDAMTAITHATLLNGLLLVIFTRPPTRFWTGGKELDGDWKPTLLAVAMLAAFEIATNIPIISKFYEIQPLARPQDYLLVAGVSLAWVFVLRQAWRGRWFEKYLGVDWD